MRDVIFYASLGIAFSLLLIIIFFEVRFQKELEKIKQKEDWRKTFYYDYAEELKKLERNK